MKTTIFVKMEPEIKRVETNKLLILNTLYYQEENDEMSSRLLNKALNKDLNKNLIKTLDGTYC